MRLAWPSPAVLGALAGLLALNLAAAVALGTGRMSLALAAAFLPLLLLVGGALVVTDRSALVYLALALALFGVPIVGHPLPIGGTNLFVPDLIVLLALGGWLGSWLVSPPAARPRWPSSPLLGWPLALFAACLAVATWRGHEAYGASLVGQPLRLVLYAGIAAAMGGLRPKEFYRNVVIIFYAGTVWQAGVSAYYLAVGGSATPTSDLSTGGTRVLAISTAWYLAGALVLALLNLGLDERQGRRALHLAIAALAAFGVVAAFGRGTFLAIAILIPVLAILLRQTSRTLLYLLPLCVPFIVLLALLVPRAAPDLVATMQDRVLGTSSSDLNVRWREEANGAIFRQVRESPVYGVGFGRGATFTLDETEYRITQDPHNSFLFLLAGGGAVTLGCFALLIGMFLLQAYRRFRTTIGVERALIVWAVSLWFVFMVNTLVGPVLTQPYLLLTVWMLMLVPAIDPASEQAIAAASASDSEPAPVPQTDAMPP
jgi:O-antigen ligase